MDEGPAPIRARPRGHVYNPPPPRAIIPGASLALLGLLAASCAPPARATRVVAVCRDGSCVDIDLCTGLTGRGDGVPLRRWVHRRHPALWIAGNDSAYNAHNAHNAHSAYTTHSAQNLSSGDAPPQAYDFYAIDSLRVPRGARVRTCEPDFAVMRQSGLDTCNNRTEAEHTCAGPNSTGPTGPTAPDNTPCVVALGSPRVQMLWLGFDVAGAARYGCHTPADLSPGLFLAPADAPNAVLPCPVDAPPDRFAWQACAPGAAACCDFECAPGYARDALTCEPMCSSAALECAWGHRASDAPCTDMGAPRYHCVPCEVRPGQRLEPWDAVLPTECRYQDCSPGHFGAGNQCEPCPRNTYSDAPGAPLCSPCEPGFESGGGEAACRACFLSDAPGDAACGPGEQMSRNATAALAHLRSSPIADSIPGVIHAVMRAWCDRNYACLPCAPGSFRQATDSPDSPDSPGKCVPCDRGFYQPEWGQTSCRACARGQSTLRRGAEAADECRCVGGFE